MSKHRPPRPSDLIDALEANPKAPFQGTIWRVVRGGRDVLQGTRSGGRWDDGTFDVLYTSVTSDGAIAEMYFHLSKGQPVIPSRVDYFVHEIEASLNAVLDLSDMSALKQLGVDVHQFGRLSYVEHQQEYPTTQQISEVAHFLEFDGILVPNARWSCSNLIVFTQRTYPDKLTEKMSIGPINWTDWAKKKP